MQAFPNKQALKGSTADAIVFFATFVSLIFGFLQIPTNWKTMDESFYPILEVLLVVDFMVKWRFVILPYFLEYRDQ